jgi:hypothetical protein
MGWREPTMTRTLKMLPPDHRQLLLDLLRPEPGYTLDYALGTTFTLDLHSLMQVPVAFLHQAGVLRRENRELDPLTILESLRRFANKLTVFAQAGYIKLPTNLPRLAALLEPCVCQVRARREGGLFHPKVWVLRFQRSSAGTEPLIRYRVLCLSRNLTFDRSWDTAVSLDGVLREDLTRAVKKENNALADFIAALPNLPYSNLSHERKQSVEQIAADLRRVEFTLPEGFDDYAFHHGGIESRDPIMPVTKRSMLIVSPFVSAGFVDRFTKDAQVTLVSRLEELDKLPRQTLEKCERLFVLNRQAIGDDLDQSDEASTELDGLHAKIFVIDHGWDSSVFTGSFNATNAAFTRNVEFMIELRGKRSAKGVGALVPFTNEEHDRTARAQCLGDLLDLYDLNTRIERSADDDEAWEKACETARIAVIEAIFRLQIAQREGAFDVQLVADNPVVLAGDHHLWAWPVAVSRTYAEELGPKTSSITFPMLTLDAVTAWVAFELRQGTGEGSRRNAWVMKLDLHGVPADREQRLLASMLQSREQLLRFLLLMLRLDGDGSFATPGDDFSWLWKKDGDATDADLQPPLLETLLRAAHQSPKTLHRIAILMSDLRQTDEGAALEDETLRLVWEPIWEAVK